MTTFLDLLNQAAAHHRAGRAVEAEALYRGLLRTEPLLGDAARLLALLLRRQDAPQAVTLARHALVVDPGIPWVLSDLGLILKDAGRTGEALRALDRAARLAPPTPDALVALAGLHQAAGSAELAEAALRAALTQRPDHLEARLALGGLAQERGDPNGAAAWLRSLLACRPDVPEGLFNLALVLHLDGRLAEAGTLYRRLLRLRPAHGRAEVAMARLRLLDGDLDAAEAALHRAAATMPANPEIAEGLARCARYRAAARTAIPPRISQGISQGKALPPAGGLVVRGPFRDTSGYAHMVRRFVHGLRDRSLAINLIDLNVDFVPLMAEGQRDPALDRLDRPVPARSLLTFAIPSVAERIPGLLPVNFTMFEAHPVPRQWMNYAAAFPHMIVPTESSRLAWLEAGFPEDRIRLCPLGVDPPAPGVTATVCVDTLGRRLADYPTRVLNVSDLIDRKNLAGLLRVWFRVTGPQDGAALVLKLGKGQPDTDRKALPFIERVARSVGKRLDQAGPLFVVQGVLSDNAMAGLFAACTHYCSLSHGEGWDLPMTQAGAAGLELIAPRHSAYTTYLDDTVAHLVPAHPAPALAPYKGLGWWNPDEDAAAGTLAGIVAGRAPPRPARDHLLGRFGWPAATARLAGILDEIGGL